MSRPQDAIVKSSRGESVEVAPKDGESASGEALPEGRARVEVEDICDEGDGQECPSYDSQECPSFGGLGSLPSAFH